MHSKKEFDLIVTGLIMKYECKNICMKHDKTSKIPSFLGENISFTSHLVEDEYVESQNRYNHLHSKAKCSAIKLSPRRKYDQKYDCIVLSEGYLKYLNETVHNLSENGIVIAVVDTFLQNPYLFVVKDVVRTPNFLFVVLSREHVKDFSIDMTLTSTALDDFENEGAYALKKIEGNPAFHIAVTEDSFIQHHRSLEPSDYLTFSIPDKYGMRVMPLSECITLCHDEGKDLSLMDSQMIHVINREFLLGGNLSFGQGYERALTANDIPEEDSYDTIYKMIELDKDTLICFPRIGKFFHFSPMDGPAYLHFNEEVYTIDTIKVNPEYLCAELSKEYVLRQLKRYGNVSSKLMDDDYWRLHDRAKQHKGVLWGYLGDKETMRRGDMESLLIYAPTDDPKLFKQEKLFIQERNKFVHNYIKQLDMSISQDGCLGCNEIINDRYRVIDAIDNGGFAKVYRVVDMKTSAIYAMKELFPREICYRKPLSSVIDVPSKEEDAYDHFKRIFKGENEMLRTVSKGNANIPQVYSDVIMQNNTCYYIMDFVDNDTLMNRLDKPLPFKEALDIFVKLTICTHKVHAKNHYHMDITPRNIMFKGKDMTPMLVDFGNARSYDIVRETILHKSMMAHTPGYAPPEQLKGRGGINMISCDIYGLGACLYFMLTFEHPYFREFNCYDKFLAHIYDKLEDFNVPDAVIEVITKCLAENPQDRFRSMKEILLALNDFLSEEDKINVSSLEDSDLSHACTEI